MHWWLAKAAVSSLCSLILLPPNLKHMEYEGSDMALTALNWLDLKYAVFGARLTLHELCSST